MYKIFNLDAVEFLKTLDNESVDLLICDLPYESLEKYRKIGTTTRLKNSKASSNEWFEIFKNDRFSEFFKEVYRVLKKNSHFYFFSDQTTMFVAKPVGEDTGFKFWKGIVWGKCLEENTPIMTNRGVVKIKDIQYSDLVYNTKGNLVKINGIRNSVKPVIEINFKNKQKIKVTSDHRFLVNNSLKEVNELKIGDVLDSNSNYSGNLTEIDILDFIPKENLIVDINKTNNCMWCGKTFKNKRGVSAHQARFCEKAPIHASKKDMSNDIGITPKTLRRWIANRELPYLWAEKLNILPDKIDRYRLYLSNDKNIWYNPKVEINYELGKIIGLFLAEGNFHKNSVSFAFNEREFTLMKFISRYVRKYNINTTQRKVDDPKCIVLNIGSYFFKQLIKYFVGGSVSYDKFLKPSFYKTPICFQNGLFKGLIEGDGHWSEKEKRESYSTTSIDLAYSYYRFLTFKGYRPFIHRRENDYRGYYIVSYDPYMKPLSFEIKEINNLEEENVVDLSIEDKEHLFTLGNGIITHNCKIGMGYHYRAMHEMILFFEKGKLKLNDLSIPDILNYDRVYRGYPTEKPVGLLEVLVRQSSKEGQLIVDPFMGSGTTGLACLRNNRNFYGNDKSKEAVNVTLQRFNNLERKIKDE